MPNSDDNSTTSRFYDFRTRPFDGINKRVTYQFWPAFESELKRKGLSSLFDEKYHPLPIALVYDRSSPRQLRSSAPPVLDHFSPLGPFGPVLGCVGRALVPIGEYKIIPPFHVGSTPRTVGRTHRSSSLCHE